MKVIAIIQARMGSTRLPGKVLKEINNKPLLEYEMERLKKSKKIDELIIATTSNQVDDSIIKFCKEHNIEFYRGSENDVLSRYYEAAKEFNADIIVRLTSDCPIIDPVIVDNVISTILNRKYDYVSNTLNRTYPRGMDTEVFTFDALKKAYLKANRSFEREHVTPYIYLNPETFHLYNLKNAIDYSSHRWTVDTKKDFLLIKTIINHFYSQPYDFKMEDVVAYLDQYPELKKINSEIEQKKLGL